VEGKTPKKQLSKSWTFVRGLNLDQPFTFTSALESPIVRLNPFLKPVLLPLLPNGALAVKCCLQLNPDNLFSHVDITTFQPFLLHHLMLGGFLFLSSFSFFLSFFLTGV
jgi:hypothetical protein